MKNKSNRGTVGVTLMPGAIEEPSPDENVHISVSSFLSPIDQVHNTAHEAYGHAYFYELKKQGYVIDPFHRREGVGYYLEFDEECNTYSPVMVP